MTTLRETRFPIHDEPLRSIFEAGMENEEESGIVKGYVGVQ